MTVKPTRPDRQRTAAKGATPPRPASIENLLRQPQTHWLRAARYNWDKGGSKGGR